MREIAVRIRGILGASVPLELGAVQTRSDDAWRLCADTRKARVLLSWRPRVPFPEGVQRTAEWIRARAQTPVRR